MNAQLADRLKEHLHRLHAAVATAQLILPGALRGDADAIGALADLEVNLAATTHTLSVTWAELCSCTPYRACPIHSAEEVGR
jgi:hypothetical protein